MTRVRSTPKAKPLAAKEPDQISAGADGDTPHHVISILDIQDDLPQIVQAAINFRNRWGTARGQAWLEDRMGVMIFEKPSTRTRVSFEAGMRHLGMGPITLPVRETQLGRGERPKDTARVLSRYGDVLVIRGRHDLVEELALHATVPIINALTELEHPCQALADIAVMQEHFGDLEGRTLAWIGDGNNVCNSLMLASLAMGMHVNLAIPEGYEPPQDLLDAARALAEEKGVTVQLVRDPEKAVATADAIATDTWVSMGDEEEAYARRQTFGPYQVNMGLLGLAPSHAVVLHCLPAHYGEEITEEVADSPQSLIWDEAEYRMWAQMALLTWLLEPTILSGAAGTGRSA